MAKDIDIFVVSYGHLSQDEIDSFRKRLLQHEIRYSVDNADSHTYAWLTIEDITNYAEIILSSRVVTDITIGIAGSALYDILKKLTSIIWKRSKKTKNLTLKETSLDIKKLSENDWKEIINKAQPVKFGWKVKINAELTVSFRIEQTLTKIEYEELMKSFKVELTKKLFTSKRKGEYWMVYDFSKKKWKYFDIKKIRERHRR